MVDSAGLGGSRPRHASCGTSTVLFVEVSMTASLQRKRARAAQRQDHVCYYCGMPVWDKDPIAFMSEYGLTRKQARMLRCTAEHLKARADGGSDSNHNIVAACWFCNSRRHLARTPLSPVEYRARVSDRMRRGRWLAGVVPHLATHSAVSSKVPPRA